MLSLDYLKTGEEIYRQSFEIIRREADLSKVPEPIKPMVIRMIHACGMVDLVEDLRWSKQWPEVVAHLKPLGPSMIADAQMVKSGIMKKNLKLGQGIDCILDHPNLAEIAEQRQTTQSAAGLYLSRDQWVGKILVIGNAPTALFQLLELLAQNPTVKPAAILAFPVGFVGAAESKAALVAGDFNVPYLTLLGRRGGSAIAAAAVNGWFGKGEELG